MAMHFAIFHQHDTPTFKTKALHLISDEGRLKRLLLLYKWLLRPYLSLLWLRISGARWPVPGTAWFLEITFNAQKYVCVFAPEAINN